MGNKQQVLQFTTLVSSALYVYFNGCEFGSCSVMPCAKSVVWTVIDSAVPSCQILSISSGDQHPYIFLESNPKPMQNLTRDATGAHFSFSELCLTCI